MTIFLEPREVPLRLATSEAANRAELYDRCRALLGDDALSEDVHESVASFRKADQLDPDEIAPDARGFAAGKVDDLLEGSHLTGTDIVKAAAAVAERQATRETVGVLVPSLQDTAAERFLAVWQAHTPAIHSAITEHVEQYNSGRLAQIGAELPSDFSDVIAVYSIEPLKELWADLTTLDQLIQLGLHIDSSANPEQRTDPPSGSWLVRIARDPFAIGTLSDLHLGGETFQGRITVFSGEAMNDSRHKLRQLAQFGTTLTLRSREQAATFLQDNYFGLDDLRRNEVVEANEKTTAELGQYFIKNG